jgi:hypothetical protein
MDITRSSIAGISARFQAQADRSLEAQGIDPAAFNQYCWQNHPGETKDAARAVVATRNPNALAPAGVLGNATAPAIVQ